MSRILLARRAQGELVRKAQTGLIALGLNPGIVDGDFGPKTERAVKRLQRAQSAEETGAIDGLAWVTITATDPPGALEFCLQLTAAFEGHGFRLAQGNFDGAGITWGIIGFTLQSGGIKTIVERVRRRRPELVEQSFGRRAATLLEMLASPAARRIAWADSISIGASKARLAKPWRDAFEQFGGRPEVQQEQLRLAEEDYFRPALATARRHQLRSLLGLALAFDIHVQNGGIKARSRKKIKEELAARRVAAERDRRILIAYAVADSASPRWREDVRTRKLTIASGAGRVHGLTYVLENWGLGEAPA